jgi:hypothetical protein
VFFERRVAAGSAWGSEQLFLIESEAMSEPVTLLVPVEERYRDLAPELARKYMELAGGSSTDATALADAVRATLAEMATSQGADEDVHLAFRVETQGVEIQVRCGSRSSIVTKPLPARNT